MKTFAKITALLLYTAFAAAQNHANNDFARLVEAERKSASALTTFRANLNTGNYDVIHQDLNLTVNPSVQFISGTITTTYIAKSPMNTLTFDLDNQLTVSSVTQNGNSLAFTQNSNDELVITLPALQNTGVQATVAVTYSGAPPTSQQAFVTATHNGTPILWTLSQPYGAKDWWPCKQDLNDKISTVDIHITAPSAYVSVANGLQVSQVANSNGTKTTHYEHNFPIPAYLVAIAVTNYSIFTQTAGTAPNTFPVVNYIYPETQSSVQTQLAQTLPIMNLFEQLFEAYPYHTEKYGHAQCGFGGGMEHTTVSFMGSFGRELIAHELAHQWFGNKVTCGSWKDIWLNEGFATYLSGLVVENIDGNASFINWKADKINNITSATGGAVYLTDTDTTNVNRIFSNRLSYNKGAMVAHMLRYKLGNANFYQGLKNFLADPDLAFGYAKTPDLKAHLEAVSGMDLTGFFNDWVYNQGYPTYTITAQNTAPGQATVTINQTQSHPSVSYFEMPVPVRLTGTGGQTLTVILENTFSGQQFNVSVPFTVTGLAFDPEKNIISRNSTATLGTEAFEGLKAVKLFPNPAGNLLNVELPEGITLQKAAFYNVLGQKVLETGATTTWDVSAMASGLHFLSLVTDKGTTQLEFIKE
ncbi:peptidase M1 [Flavobacterium cyanobacteriorum]|uniref:Aminopeptidase N n=1 Tax=Flavobacterium cyanobacteriorum TaxID=2022802 RepID=A0A255ZM60_9FLAO|nr:M1 family aminopeptidase [Flavobacterium cyanobacteriorum]OYQ42657.1 peptidase M1 [Flavobacterium cyanobacteriorum]